MKKQELIKKLETVKSVASAFLSVDDVISMINELEDGSFSMNVDKIDEIAEKIAEKIARDSFNLVDDYDLTMDGREVTLDSVDLDESGISEIVTEVLTDFFDAE